MCVCGVGTLFICTDQYPFVMICNHACLQLHTAISEHVDPSKLGLSSGSTLLLSLKDCLVGLSCSVEGPCSEVQEAAQDTLSTCWKILLPTVEERAGTLTLFLQAEDRECSLKGGSVTLTTLCTLVFVEDSLGELPGRQFMVDLLVRSLVTEGVLEDAISAAIGRRGGVTVATPSSTLLDLMEHLLRTFTRIDIAALCQVNPTLYMVST